jgi:2-hydroxychromene-2-carboxylate isomerase
MADLFEVKFYYDYKSPFTYLALEPACALERSHRVKLRFIPHELDVRGAFGGELDERPDKSWSKVRYLYLDARRFANERGLLVRGPQKIFDSRLSLMSGIFADRHGKWIPYSELVFERFFKRELNIEDSSALESVMAEVGLKPEEFRSFVNDDGPAALADSFAEGDRDNVFGVPTLMIDGEPFWGNDRVDWVLKKLDAMGLRRNVRTTHSQR